jgi:peptidoglycan biosynthesis protein MviN/MurJ (putative lipid II flippase)
MVRTAVILLGIVVVARADAVWLVPACFVGGEAARVWICRSYLPLPRDCSGTSGVGEFESRVSCHLPSTVLSSANPMVDRYLAVGLHFGTAAVYDLAEKAANLFTLAITQGVLPVLHRRWAREEDPQLRERAIRNGVRSVARGSVATAVVAAGLVWFGAPIVLRGLGDGAVHEVQRCSVLFLIGAPGYAVTQVIVRKLVLDGRTSVLIPLSAGQLLVNGVLDVVLGRQYGLPGVALATSVMQWLTALLLWRHAMSERARAEAPSASVVLQEV